MNLCLHVDHTKFFKNSYLNTCKSKTKNVKTYDFSTLYTNIGHKNLINKINKLLDNTFKDPTPKYMILNTKTKHTYFSHSKIKIKNKNNHIIDKETLKNHISFLINNIYLSFCQQLHKQIIGIPMGTDCAPLIANLYLHTYEFKFLMR